MHEHELEQLLKETFTQDVKAHLGRIADFEYEIVEELPERAAPSTRLQWGLALAGVLVLFVSGMWVGSNFLDVAPCADPHVLCLVYPEAKSVSLAGQFADWEPLPMHGPDRSGVWWIRLTVEPGRYEYGFIVDGLRWIYDPRATEFVHTFDGKINSVMYVSR